MLIQEEEYEETSLWNEHKKVDRMADWKRLLLYIYELVSESLIICC